MLEHIYNAFLLRQWGACNVYPLVLSTWKVNIAKSPIAVSNGVIDTFEPCHFVRLLNIEIGVEYWMTYVVLFFNVHVKLIFGHLRQLEKAAWFQYKTCTAIHSYFLKNTKQKSKQIFKSWRQFQYLTTCWNGMIHCMF